LPFQCTFPYAEGIGVELTADSQALMRSWSGDCAGTNPIYCTMTQDQHVTLTLSN
jgi:hypothetical protein